jgi:hypothetical protein
MIATTDQPYILRVAALLLLFAGMILCLQPDQARAGKGLLENVIGLDLGLQGYTIGKKLTPEQRKIAKSHAEKDAHQGTLKFVDQDLHVVVDKDSGRVLALYKRRENADQNTMKAMVADLMDRFGAPTVMAHDKIIYWAYNRHGAISEEDFARAKKVDQVPKLGIIATVKLNSELEILPGPVDEKKKDKGAAEAEQKKKGVVYFIISSDPLVQKFLVRQSEK